MTAAASTRPSPRPGSTWRATSRPASTPRPRRYTTSAFMRLKLGDALTRREMAPHVFETAAEMAANPPARAPVTPHLRTHLGLSFWGFHHLAYWEWGPEEAERTVVCVHGLTRQARRLRRPGAGPRPHRPPGGLPRSGRAGHERLAWRRRGLHAGPVLRRHERADRPARRRSGGLGRQLAGRADRHDPGRPAADPDPPPRHQRYRPLHPRCGRAPDRPLPQRPAAPLPRPCRSRGPFPRDPGPLRHALRPGVAPPHRAQHPPPCRGRVHPALRPRHRRGLPPLARGQRHHVGPVGEGTLPDPPSPRRRIGHAAGLDGARR